MTRGPTRRGGQHHPVFPAPHVSELIVARSRPHRHRAIRRQHTDGADLATLGLLIDGRIEHDWMTEKPWGCGVSDEVYDFSNPMARRIGSGASPIA